MKIQEIKIELNNGYNYEEKYLNSINIIINNKYNICSII